MTLVAVHAVIDISADTRVPRVRLGLGVATSALKNGVIVRIGVAGRAHAVGIAMVHGEPGVVEGCACPSRCGVTRRASSCEHSGRG